jgi:uncharacterized membrane protein
MRLSYIIGPLVVLFLALALSACFFHLLPAELATHFELDGTPDGWLSREMTMVWTLLPQLIFVLVAWGVAWVVTRLSRRFGQMKGAGLRTEGVLLFMGNIIALPQLLLCFAMVDIFSYNLYQRHLMPIWIFPLVALGLVTIAVGMFLFYIFSKVRGGQRG